MKNELSIEDKLLLIKDLSARLPYAVTVEHTSGFRGTLHNITVHHMYDDNDNVYDAICYTDFFGIMMIFILNSSNHISSHCQA